MAQSLNKVMFIGNLGKVPAFKDHGDGFVTATLRVATTESWKARDTGERRERTDWHTIEVSGPLAEICRDILTEGNELVYVEGRLHHDRAERDGEVTYYTKIRADVVNKLSKRDRADVGDAQGGGQEERSSEGGSGAGGQAAGSHDTGDRSVGSESAPPSAAAAGGQASAQGGSGRTGVGTGAPNKWRRRG